MMDLDNVVSRELTVAELEGIVGGMGRARAARAQKNGTTASTGRRRRGATSRTTTPTATPVMMTTTPIVTTM